MSAPERVYRVLLRAYPASFRTAYGREMTLLFRDQLNDRRRASERRGEARAGVGAYARFWAAVVWDVTRSAPALRLDALRARSRARADGPWVGGPHLHPEGGTMRARRTVAALAILGGAYELVNSAAEAWSGGGASRGDAGWVLAIALGVVMGTLLAGAGLALLRPGAAAARVARGAALACLALVVGILLLFPYMSILSRMVGVGVPLALLVVGRRPRGTPGRDPSVHAVA
ncbi:MAG: hypothetical protein ACXW61_01910 [Gemmatirosa sp.]